MLTRKSLMHLSDVPFLAEWKCSQSENGARGEPADAIEFTARTYLLFSAIK